jgi:hypothetical protein
VSNLPPPSTPGPGWGPPGSDSSASSSTPAAWTPVQGQPPQKLESIYHGIGMVILLSIVTCGIWTFLWAYRTGEELKRYNGDGLGGVVNLVLTIFVSPVVMFTIPNEIEHMYQRDGRQSPVSTLWGLWFLLPIIGNIIWYVKVQDALNEFWLAKGTQPL